MFINLWEWQCNHWVTPAVTQKCDCLLFFFLSRTLACNFPREMPKKTILRKGRTRFLVKYPRPPGMSYPVSIHKMRMVWQGETQSYYTAWFLAFGCVLWIPNRLFPSFLASLDETKLLTGGKRSRCGGGGQFWRFWLRIEDNGTEVWVDYYECTAYLQNCRT